MWRRGLDNDIKEWLWQWLVRLSLFQVFCTAQLSCFFWFHRLSRHVSVLRQIFRAIRGDTERFHGDLQCVFEALSLASLGALALREFVAEKFLREVLIFHVDRTWRTKLWLNQDGVDAWKRKPKLKPRCRGCAFATWRREFSSGRVKVV